MNFIRILDRRAMYLAMAFVLVLMSLVLPAMASAAQITTRSIALSSSSKAATNVTYEVTFTPAANAGAFVVDFCSDSPVIGATCTAPGGFSATSADSASAGVTDTTGAASKFTVEVPLVADTPITVEVTGITNPSAAGPLYARIITFDNETNALAYTSPTVGTGAVDTGSVAISITDTIGVTGAVLESMLFCVSSATILEDCEDADQNPPTIALGEDVGGNTALVPTAVSTGILYTQISTNAGGGAVVTLKSDAADCGGLLRLGDEEECYIEPALAGNITAGQAKFGLLVGAAYPTADAEGTPTGTLQAVTGSGYNDTTYALNYVDGDATGVTSAYGDPLLDTNNAPANNQNVNVTFGASVSNDTPAGTYAANLSMIATGRF